MSPKISGARFAIRRARDMRGSGITGNNIFVGDRVARGADSDQLEPYRVYSTIDFAQIMIDGGSSDPIGSNPYDSPTGLMACMDIGLQAEVYPS